MNKKISVMVFTFLSLVSTVVAYEAKFGVKDKARMGMDFILNFFKILIIEYWWFLLIVIFVVWMFKKVNGNNNQLIE